MFHFTGSLTEPAVHAALQIKGINDFGSFWLENSAITFTAESGKLQEAVITGSKTQQEQIRFGSTVNNDTQSISFIRHHPKSIVSAYILSIYASTWGKATSALLYNHLSKKIKNTPYAEDVLEFITTNKNPKIGEKYVDFTLPNAEGKNVSLSDFKNKVVLLDFWGSWCGPCRANNPELVKIYNEFNGRGFEILGVAADLEKAQWINAIKKDGLTWENVTDLKGWNNKPALIYGINHYPTNYLIDKNGTIVAMDISSNDLRNKLREMLN